jgi:hypothetical protein
VSSGDVMLGATSSLDLSLGYEPALGAQFILVDLADPTELVAGEFDGLAEGSTFYVDGNEFEITYVGGDNHNDVVVTDIAPAAVPEPSTVGLFLLAGSMLVLAARRRTMQA